MEKYQNLLKKTTIYCFVFFIIAVVGMLYYDANKVIVIANADDSIVQADSDTEKILQTQYPVLMEKDSKIKESIVIPLESVILAENVQIQNHYIDKELWIGIYGAEANFYARECITGDIEKIQYGGYDIVDNILWIKLLMKDTFEIESTMSNGKLTIRLMKPSEIYDKIIVLDAGHGGSDTGIISGKINEKDIALNVILFLQEELKESNIKVYCTRNDDSDVKMEKRIQFANEVGADMLISVHTDFSNDNMQSGITSIYNGQYFIQDFDSIQLADKLEKAVIKTTGAQVGGISEITDSDRLVKEATIPAAQINIGYLSNETEKKILQDEVYQKKIAEGIYNAILEIYKEKTEE